MGESKGQAAMRGVSEAHGQKERGPTATTGVPEPIIFDVITV
jgi:hypothetical protein